MFKTFSKIKAYTKMAHALDQLNIQLSELLNSLEKGHSQDALNEQIIGLTFMVRRDIYNPQDKYNWNPIGPIRINSIDSSNISLQTAIETIQNKINQIGSHCDYRMVESIKNILDKGDLYLQLENMPGINKY